MCTLTFLHKFQNVQTESVSEVELRIGLSCKPFFRVYSFKVIPFGFIPKLQSVFLVCSFEVIPCNVNVLDYSFGVIPRLNSSLFLRA